MSSDQDVDWRTAYQAALLEVDAAKLPERIEQAYKAIQAYMGDGYRTSAREEYEALIDALANLRVLRREIGLPLEDSKPDSPSASNQ